MAGECSNRVSCLGVKGIPTHHGVTPVERFHSLTLTLTRDHRKLTIMPKDPTCAERIAERMASRESALRLLTQRDAPDSADDAAFALTWLDDAVSSYGIELDEYDSAVVAGFRVRSAEDAPVGTPDVDDVISDDNGAYSSETYADAFQSILNDVASRTEDDRDTALREYPLGVGTSVAIRVDLSTGGPADYVTAEVDTETRSVSNVVYHFADWFDHAEKSVRDDSPLARMIEDYAEYIDLGTGDN